MKRYVSLEEISDGKLYRAHDLVKADCLGCNACSKCCHGMGDTIILDPMDGYRLQTEAKLSMQQLLADGYVSLGVVDGVIMPHLAMRGEEQVCGFLDENGRCSIHSARPGICRLFPLGRYYEDGSFRYFLQTGECDHPKAKIKISKWLDIPEISKYEAFVRDWHALVKEAENAMKESDDEELSKNWNMLILRLFYLMPYDGKTDFYSQFETRANQYREICDEER